MFAVKFSRLFPPRVSIFSNTLFVYFLLVLVGFYFNNKLFIHHDFKMARPLEVSENCKCLKVLLCFINWWPRLSFKVRVNSAVPRMNKYLGCFFPLRSSDEMRLIIVFEVNDSILDMSVRNYFKICSGSGVCTRSSRLRRLKFTFSVSVSIVIRVQFPLQISLRLHEFSLQSTA